MATYTGGCHCGAVRYRVDADLESVIRCNCSHCGRKGFILAFTSKDAFELLSGEENLTEYLFNKKAIRHLFCKTCGVQSYSESIETPGMAINVRCLDDVDADFLSPKFFNGRDA